MDATNPEAQNKQWRHSPEQLTVVDVWFNGEKRLYATETQDRIGTQSVSINNVYLQTTTRYQWSINDNSDIFINAKEN